MKLKHWINKNYKNIIITAFLIPIITVALVSISHVTQWYKMSNAPGWAVYLSVGVEIAAMSALAAIAARMGKKAYFPFIVVTLIQFIGNIFFSYAFIDVNSEMFKSWVDLVSPVLGLTGVEPTNLIAHKRFLAFFSGGLLPIISLSFLHMLIRFTEEDRVRDLSTDNNIDEPKEELPKNDEPLVVLDSSKVVEAPKAEEIQIPREVIEDAMRVKLSQDDLALLENHLRKIPYTEKNKPEENIDTEVVDNPIPWPSTPEEVEAENEVNQIIEDHFWESDEEPKWTGTEFLTGLVAEDLGLIGNYNTPKVNTEPEAVNTEPEAVNTEPEVVNTEPEPSYEKEPIDESYLAPEENTTSFIASVDPITEDPEVVIMKVDPETEIIEQIIPKLKENTTEEVKKKD